MEGHALEWLAATNDPCLLLMVAGVIVGLIVFAVRICDVGFPAQDDDEETDDVNADHFDRLYSED